MTDLDSIVEDAFLKGEAAKAESAGKTESAAPAPKEPSAPDKTDETADDPADDGSLATKADDPAKTDTGAPQPTEPKSEPEPTPTTEDALAEAYRLADIDPKDPQAAPKLAAHLKASKEPKPAETPKEEDEPKLATDDEIGKSVADFINGDKDCLALASEHGQLEDTLKGYADQMKASNQAIASLEARLNPPKIEGVPDLELSEVEQDDLQRRLDNAERDNRRLERHIENTIKKRDAVVGKWKDRVEKHTQSQLDNRDTVKRTAAEKAEHAAVTTREKAQFEAAFEAEFKDSGLPAEVRTRVQENVRMRAHAHLQKAIDEGKGGLIEDKRAFYKHLLKGEVEAYEAHHKLKSRDYANDKRTDAKQTAPNAPASEKHQPGGQPKAVARDKHEARDEILDNARARR